MKYNNSAKDILTVLVAFLLSQACYSQAKLVVNGAKINMASSVFLSTKDISLSGGSTVTVGSSTIKIAGTMASAGSLDITAGTLETNGTNSQVIPANVLLNNEVKNLTVTNNSGVAMQGNLALTDVLSLNTGTLASNGFLTLKSTYIRTARVAPVTSIATTPISGDVTVERFIPGKRANRFLTAPINSTRGIRANWMENTNNTSTTVNNDPAPGFGTHITGNPAKGFDNTATQNASMFTYNALSQTWKAIPDTGFLYTIGNGYRIIVRGSRNTDLNNNNAIPSLTTLRAKGSLITGTIVIAKPGGGGTTGTPELATAINGYALVGNPYASVLDWDKVEKTDISTSIDIFDPTLNGSGGRGQFVSYNSTFHTTSNGSNFDNNLQSGQAFFVKTTGLNPSVTFKELHKASANRNVFRTNNDIPKLTVQLLLPSQVNTPEAADACLVFFSPDYSSNLSYEDSYKITNQDENLGVLVQGKVLSIAGRQPVDAQDTVELKVWQLTLPAYSLRIKLENFEPQVQAFLYDSYLKTSTAINAEAETVIPFSINADTTSIATSRFKIIFKSATTLASELLTVKAYEKNKGLLVEWTFVTESEITKYVIEKSLNGQQFVMADSLNAKQNHSINYTWFDMKPYNDNNYYRIRSIDKSGAVNYSNIVKVQRRNTSTGFVITNNPVTGSAINFQIRNLAKGNYSATLINTTGQEVYKTQVFYAGGVTNEILKLNNKLPAGIYYMHLAGANKEESSKLLVE